MRRENDVITYEVGDYVTVTPNDNDPLILHMQKHATVHAYAGAGSYTVRLYSVSPDNAIHGPIGAARLTSGWVEQDGRVRVDIYGHKVLPGEHSAGDGYPGRWCGAGHCAGVRR